MKKMFTFLAMALCTLLATAQTNQYFWLNGNLMFGTPIAQTDSITFGVSGRVDTLQLLLPQALTIVVHDTIYITNCDKQDEDDNPEGALPGVFSVSPTKKVRFSKGNLQYNAAFGTHQCADGTTQQGTWRFAEHQWDYVGDATNGTVYENGVKCDNSLISQTYNGWIDLFGWGTSGWNSGAVAYQPYSCTSNSYDYYPIGMNQLNLTGSFANGDWGVYNSISNGGNKPNYWRTLTMDEWNYIINERPNSDSLHFWAKVSVEQYEIVGLILLPGDYNFRNKLLFDYENFNILGYDSMFKDLENSGAVFLPCAQFRLSNQCSGNNQKGAYWSSSLLSQDNARNLLITPFQLNAQNINYSGYGHSVRLVQDVE